MTLPSALRVPLSGPSASAELAPVPGKSDHGGDLAELGEAETPGLGAGAGAGGGGGDGGGGGSEGLVGGGGGEGGNPRTKRCVGDPPRQTEDLLSPPCVAHFAGDNGGSTATGVTGTEIVILHVTDACQTDTVRVVDYRADRDNPYGSPFIAAFQDYFTERYQLYGRSARFISFSYPCREFPPGPAETKATASDLYDRFRPFAVFADRIAVYTGFDLLLHELAHMGVIVTTVTAPYRAAAQRLAPYLLSYVPDLEDRAEVEADAVCRKLHGRTARHSGVPTDRGVIRRFAYLHDPDGGGGFIDPVHGDKDLFFAALKRRCGLTDIPVSTARGNERKAIELDRLRREGVTTILFYGETNAWSLAADSIKWYPEWFLGGTSANAKAAINQAPAVWANAFGVSYERRRDQLYKQDWYLAFRQHCGGNCDASPEWRASMAYEDLMLLFWGIQSAGPRLTPANFDRGLHAIQPRPSPNPYTPAAYFSPGNFSWIKDAMFVWWDTQGRPPGGQPTGCYRLVEAGARNRAGEWPAGDDGIKRANASEQPCQGLI